MHALVLCTTFLLAGADGVVVGKSYDWSMSQGLVLVNQRGVNKQALAMMPGDHAARWRSKYSSVTFNQYGRELPNGGMNEAGLVVEVMWLAASVYPPADARPTVSELQWIQYQLDRFATVKEMVAAADEIRISLVYGKVHYLACDKSGDCAAFENLDGKMTVSPQARVLTNHPYAESAAYFAHPKNLRGAGSLERFARAQAMVSWTRSPKSDLVKEAFGVLDNVHSPTSVWNIVYDPARLRIWFRTHEDGRIKSFDFAKLDHSPCAPVRLLDLHADAAGDVTSRFADYGEAQNRKLVEESMRSLAGRIPQQAIGALVQYPSLMECTK
jgi:penicillin V acylase-like amidase (Ntn superfamily)